MTFRPFTPAFLRRVFADDAPPPPKTGLARDILVGAVMALIWIVTFAAIGRL